MHDRSVSHKETPDFLDVASFRRTYLQSELKRSDLPADPLSLFHTWIDAAAASPEVLESTAMVLSTDSAQGEVSSRVVLLKGYDHKGFRFFTNSGSRKASQIASNNSVSLLFFWESQERQIQISGSVSLLPRAETEAYFASRPRGSRIGAWASRQSEVLQDRETLERRVAELEGRFGKEEVPAPEFWNGYLVTPKTIEFWQGRQDRLHDRFRYSRVNNGDRKPDNWIIEQLNP